MQTISAQHLDATDTRAQILQHLADVQRLHLALSGDAQALKIFGNNGAGMAEITLAYEMLEQYLATTDAFLENMRARFETRLTTLRRAEPLLEGKPGRPELAPGHTEFWLEFSRLTAVLRRIARRGEL